MAKKNILGEGFPKYVREQVKVRQQKLGENPISDASIIKNDGKTSWIKLASSVDLNAQAQRELNITANLPENIERENYLARSLILYNGAYNDFYIDYTPQQGIFGEFTDSGDVFNLDTGQLSGEGAWTNYGGAYGFGGFEQGANPMPGILDFKVTPRNRGGIRDATINIQANNLRQFQLLESLYLRLGYHVLIEWGWSNYYDNNGNLVTRDDKTSPVLNNFLALNSNANPEYYNLLKLISQEKEKSNGNYDALLGRVVNFTWTLRDGGGYDISIRVLSAGDIIDSLTLPNLPGSTLPNTSPSSSLTIPATTVDPATVPEPSISSIHRFLWLVEHMLVEGINSKFPVLVTGSNAEPVSAEAARDYYTAVYETDYGVKPLFEKSIFEETSNPGGGTFTREIRVLRNLVPFSEPKPLVTSSNTLINELSQTFTKPNYVVPTSFGSAEVSSIGAFYAQFRDESYNPNGLNYGTECYVNFGNLLGFISKLLLYYNTSPNEPVIDIDFDLNSNYCYTYPIVPGICNTTTISVDDSVCLVNAYAYIKQDNVISTKKLWPDVYALDENPFNDGKSSHGKTMAIFLNLNFLRTCAYSSYDKVDHTINLQKFLNSILEGINSSFYGTTNLVTQIDPDTNILSILDLTQIPDIDTLGVDRTLTKFRVSGFNLGEASFLKEVNITSEISKNIAKQLMIGAQQSGNVTSNIPTGLTEFNEGYTDRVFPNRIDIYSAADLQRRIEAQNKAEKIKTLQEEASTRLFLEQWRVFKEYIELALKNGLPSNPLASQYYNAVESIVKWELSQITSDAQTILENGEVVFQGQNPPGYIPVSLNLSMEGLAGIKLFNRFTISEEYLPFSYRNKFDFIIKGITHTVKDNYWATDVESLCVPKAKTVIGFPVDTPTSITTLDTPNPDPKKSSPCNDKDTAKAQKDGFGELIPRGRTDLIPTPFNTKFTPQSNKNIIYAMFRIAGFTHVQAVAALANAQAESSFNNLAIGGNGECASLGLFQTHTVSGAGFAALKGNYRYVKPTQRVQLFNPYINTLVIISVAASKSTFVKSTDLASAVNAFTRQVENPSNPDLKVKQRITIADSPGLKNFSLTKAQYKTIAALLEQYTFGVQPNGTNALVALLSTARINGLTANTKLYKD